MNIAQLIRPCSIATAALLSTSSFAVSVAVAQSAAPSSPSVSRSALTLEDVLAATAMQHPLIESARARLSAAQGSRRAAGTLPNPVATYQVENAAFPGQSPLVGLDRETSTFVTLPLEPLYQRRPRVRRADQEVTASRAIVTTVQRRVALDAARAFYRVAIAQVWVSATEETRAGLESLTSFNRVRVAEGATAEGDLIRVQVELDRAAVNVALAEVELARARAELQPFVGGVLSTGAVLDSLLVSVPNVATPNVVLAPVSEFMNRASLSRPELIEARARVAAVRADVSYQRTLTVRQVGATVGTKRINGANSMIAGVSVPLPIFDRNSGEVQRATGERIAAEQELAWAERTIAAQVHAAYEATRRLSLQVARLQSSFLDRAEEARRITLAAYQEGAATLLQVLDASRTLGEARLTYFRVLFDQRQSILDLTVAAGGEPATTLNTLETSSAATSAASLRDGGSR
ncbi:MAG: TolC family protein [Gemmatimonadaceae bacterium]